MSLIFNRKAGITYSVEIKELIDDESLLSELAEHLDIETGGECTPVDYLKQTLQHIQDERRVAYHLRRLAELNN